MKLEAREYIRKSDALYEFKIDTSPDAIPNSIVVDDYKSRSELIEILKENNKEKVDDN